MNRIFSALLIVLLIAPPAFAKEKLSVFQRLQRYSIQKLKNIPGQKVAFLGLGKKKSNTENEVEETDEGGQAGTPDTLANSDVSPEMVEIIPQGPLTATTPWKKPIYDGQSGALGYKSDTFEVPNGLKDRVAFWKDIYSKYTTNQGVMHDSLHINIVYRAVDFGSIMRDSNLNPRQKHHARERLVNSYRKEIEERLNRLAKLTSADGLEGEDLRVWKLYEKVNDPNKFAAATKRGRVRFQLGQKDRFALGIYYSGRYIREMEKIFKSEGLPIELTRLPFVESSFNVYARSKVGASGIWQFMRRTARPYMMVNSAVDERNDPIRSTRSSAKLLRSNYMMLRSWPLALTGYNHGPSGIARIVRKTGTNDLVQIINNYSSRRFGFASENFYACFLAALEVERNADKYFSGVKWSVPLEHAEVKLPKPIPFEAVKIWFKSDADLAQLYNPHFSHSVRRGRMNMPKGTNVRVPVEMKEIATRFVNGNMKIAEMRSESERDYQKIPTLPSGTPVATISAAPESIPVSVPQPTKEVKEAKADDVSEMAKDVFAEDVASEITAAPVAPAAVEGEGDLPPSQEETPQTQ